MISVGGDTPGCIHRCVVHWGHDVKSATISVAGLFVCFGIEVLKSHVRAVGPCLYSSAFDVLLSPT